MSNKRDARNGNACDLDFTVMFMQITYVFVFVFFFLCVCVFPHLSVCAVSVIVCLCVRAYVQHAIYACQFTCFEKLI